MGEVKGLNRWGRDRNLVWDKTSSGQYDPHFQQLEKRVSLEDMFGKFIEKTEQYMEANNHFMRKTETTLQNQVMSIKNLETIIGQMAVTISGKVLGTLPRNIEMNHKEHAKAITTRNGVQLLEIHVKRQVADKENVLSTIEKCME
ncbi:reverse transcriptase [Abeliophyllum distichum]|uniref:Reverse transcriptase n=1 Tax=Abeliophyllum distichum TaxID=126358 RepID=A0ABD1SAV0_9LAMI